MELLSNPTFLQVIVVILAVFSTVSLAINLSGTQRKRNAAIRQCEELLELLRATIKMLKEEMSKPGPTLAPPVVREVLPVGPIEDEDLPPSMRSLTPEEMKAIFPPFPTPGSASYFRRADTPDTEEKNDDEG